MRSLLFGCLSFALTGCALVPPDRLPITDEKREFTYDFQAPGKTKAELFKIARVYFATSFGDVTKVSKVEDELDGTIIGKAVVPWHLSNDSALIPYIPCASNYNIAFVAKDGKARLQLTLLEGAVLSSCGWTLPAKRDYPQVVGEFNALAGGLTTAIQGNSALDKLKDF